jgi:hypothetical protein
VQCRVVCVVPWRAVRLCAVVCSCVQGAINIEASQLKLRFAWGPEVIHGSWQRFLAGRYAVSAASAPSFIHATSATRRPALQPLCYPTGTSFRL